MPEEHACERASICIYDAMRTSEIVAWSVNDHTARTIYQAMIVARVHRAWGACDSVCCCCVWSAAVCTTIDTHDF